jgi:hypothetical protein
MAIEAEAAISLLPLPDQEPIRYQIAKDLDRLARTSNQKTSYNTLAYKEKRILKGIREKLNCNNATITKADKGQSLIIIDKIAYDSKILNFLNNNNFQTGQKIQPISSKMKSRKS